MNTKIIIAATVAALSLASTAFAGEGGGYDQSPAPAGRQFSFGGLDNTTLPENGQNGSVESPNAVPPGAMAGTPAYMYAQSVERYYAQQADRRFAETHRLHPNG